MLDDNGSLFQYVKGQGGLHEPYEASFLPPGDASSVGTSSTGAYRRSRDMSQQQRAPRSETGVKSSGSRVRTRSVDSGGPTPRNGPPMKFASTRRVPTVDAASIKQRLNLTPRSQVNPVLRDASNPSASLKLQGRLELPKPGVAPSAMTVSAYRVAKASAVSTSTPTGSAMEPDWDLPSQQGSGIGSGEAPEPSPDSPRPLMPPALSSQDSYGNVSVFTIPGQHPRGSGSLYKYHMPTPVLDPQSASSGAAGLDRASPNPDDDASFVSDLIAPPAPAEPPDHVLLDSRPRQPSSNPKDTEHVSYADKHKRRSQASTAIAEMSAGVSVSKRHVFEVRGFPFVFVFRTVACWSWRDGCCVLCHSCHLRVPARAAWCYRHCWKPFTTRMTTLLPGQRCSLDCGFGEASVRFHVVSFACFAFPNAALRA
jgi:hypothetical protein